MSTIFADKLKNTSGGNPVQVNQLRGIDTAGSITVQGEGTNTTNLQQGLLKSWISANFSSQAYLDSFNQSSLSDQAAGSFRFTVTNNFANVNYACGTEARYVTSNGINTMTQDDTFARTTSQYQAYCSNDGGSVLAADTQHYQSLLAGDLA